MWFHPVKISIGRLHATWVRAFALERHQNVNFNQRDLVRGGEALRTVGLSGLSTKGFAMHPKTGLCPIAKFVSDHRSARKDDRVWNRMVASIREFGFQIPTLPRDSGEMLDGHLRLKAAKKVGISELPVILCDQWSATQLKAFWLLINILELTLRISLAQVNQVGA